MLHKSSDFLVCRRPDDFPVLPDNRLLFCDIDETILIPVSSFFRYADTAIFLDKLKEENPPFLTDVVGHWRLQRDVELTDMAVLTWIQEQKKQGPVYGLTKMSFGAFGPIPSVEKWRYLELLSFGIEFSTQPAFKSCTQEYAFYKGIFFTEHNKSVILRDICLDEKTCVLIDDKEDNLLDMQAFCEEKGCPFIGILYSSDKISAQPHPFPLLADIQKQFLLKYYIWLEDEKAKFIHNLLSYETR